MEALWIEVVREAMGVIRACRRELREDLRLETRGGPTAEWVVIRGRHSSDMCQPVGEMVGSLAESRRRGERQSAGCGKCGEDDARWSQRCGKRWVLEISMSWLKLV